ncbi:MAG: sulfite exporter TauE/SafE family protein [Granulosicoccus sp.]
MELASGDVLILLLLIITTGMIAGLLAGLLGVGGGIVIVPILFLIFDSLSFSEITSMHTAVATSLATIIPTSIASARAHHRKGNVDWALFRQWFPFLVVGAAAGGLLSTVFGSADLKLIFGVIALLVAMHMAIPGERVLANALPRSVAGQGVMASTIGVLSALMGIGGGTLSVPVLSLFSYPTHRAVGTASAFGLLIALPAVLGFIWSGWNQPERLPISLGYVNLLAAGLLFPVTTFFAPVGARIAHVLPARQLRLAFAVFLAMTATRMLWTAFSR